MSFMIVFLNSKFVDAKNAKVSVFDHGFLYGDGVYETLRTYNGKIWQLDEHLKRLKKSADLLHLKYAWTQKQIGDWVKMTVEKNKFRESRIRITVTRGENGFDFLSTRKPTICIQVKELKAQKPVVYAKGVDAISFQMERTIPKAKSLNVLPLILAQEKMKKEKAYEAILVSEKGFVREGTITNVFMIRGGIIITPRSNILEGTTRETILKFAKSAGFKIQIVDFKLSELWKADEAFITNAPRGIVPVVKIDGKKIGVGRPGVVTKELMKEFKLYIEKS